MELQFELKQTQHLTVIVGAEVEARLTALTESLSPDGVAIVYDTALTTEAKRIGEQLGTSMLLPVACDDDCKQLEVVGKLAEQLHAAGATRATVVVAIGGGTLTDLAGFVASI